jgi:hypothetical protein
MVERLALLKGNSEVACVVQTALKKQYSNHLETGQNPVHLEGFEKT